MHHPANFIFFFVSVLALAACKSEPKGDTKSTSSTAASSEPAGRTGVTASPQPSVTGLMDIPQKFAYEASHRPSHGIRPEQVYDAFTSQGFVLGARKQHLAGPFGAMYCLGSSAEKERQFFSVCEFANEAAAETGIATAKVFGTGQRNVIRNGSTILIARWEQTDTSKAEQIFRSLKPAPAP